MQNGITSSDPIFALDINILIKNITKQSMNISAFSNFDRLRLRRQSSGISGLLKGMSSFGQVYDKKVLAKKTAESDDPRLEGSEYQLLSNYVNSIDVRYSKYNKYAYNQMTEIRKRNFLIEMSLEPEIEDILDTLCNEVIVKAPDKKYVVKPIFDSIDIVDLKKEVEEQINDEIATWFPKLYRMIGFPGRGAKTAFKNWLIWGKIAWEIVYDSLEHPTKIIGIIPIDAITLTEVYDNGQKYYVQEPKFGINCQQRVLHDSQVIYIQWDEDYGRISYVERLIRYFNIYRIMERTKILWFITHSQARTHFTIPTAGKGRAKAAQTLASAMNRYSDEITFDDSTGQLFVNGQATWTCAKEFWTAETDSGQPHIEDVSADGIDLSETGSVSFYENRLYKISKIPIDRFDPSSSEAWNLDPTSQRRAEIKFSTFVNDLRDRFGISLQKPLHIHLCLKMPALLEDDEILSSVILQYEHVNVFEEMANMDIMDRKVEFIQKMQDSLVVTDAAGREHKYFPRKYLVKEYLGLSDEELKTIEKMKKEEDAYLNKLAKEEQDEYGDEEPLDGSSY